MIQRIMERKQYLSHLDKKLGVFPAVAILGARQVGKTTLARTYCQSVANFNWQTNYFDLENPTDLLRLENPKLNLQNLAGLIVIDEVQRCPELFPVLRYLIDQKGNSKKFLILGSASRDLIRQSSESLAGRIAYLELSPFSLNEIDHTEQHRLWLRGGYPRAFLANDEEASFDWLAEYVRTYLERDLPELGIRIPSLTLRRFWTMLTHNHGNLLNSSELGRSFGVADSTIKRYLDILSGTFMIRQLPPYASNTKKRLVKAPKIYFRDTGILHYFLGIRSFDGLQTHIKLGASWEGFALETVIAKRNIEPENCYFWAVHQQGEVDLLTEQDGKLEAFEFKYSDQPRITKSINLALQELPIETLTIVAPVEQSFNLSEAVWVKSLSDI